MTVLTIAEIKTEVRTILGGRTDADDRLNGVLNMSQTRLARLHDFDELRTTTTIDTAVTASPAADKIISLSTLSRYRKIYSIRLYADNSQSRKLEKVLPKRWDSVIPEPEYYSRGTPTHYVLWGKDQIELWKVPDIVYTMHFRYSRWPTLLTGATDQNSYIDLENVDDLIIHLSSSYLALSFGNIEKANELFAIYAALAKEALKQDEEDFDTFQRSHDQDSFGARTMGYNDPFVRSVHTSQD